MRNGDSKNPNGLISYVEMISQNQTEALSQTLATFFDAATFKGFESTLAGLLQTYILTESEEADPIQLADTVHQVRLITNLLLELSKVNEQSTLLATFKNMEGSLSC